MTRSKDVPRRIAYVVQNLNYGGMERVLRSLATELPSRGFEIHVVFLEYPGHFAHGLEEYAVLHQISSTTKLSVLYPRQLVNLLRSIAPDIVHSHGGIWFQAAVASRLAGVGTMVHTDHGRSEPIPLLDRVLDYLASRLTSTVIAVSEPLLEVLRRKILHDHSKGRLITNGVAVARIHSHEIRFALRDTLGIPPDATVIGSIGRLEPVKHYNLALRGFARLLPECAKRGGPLPFLVIAGDGSERTRLQTLATTLGIADQVRLLGWRDDADSIYGAFDLFTLTSLSEGTSISLLEAMSAGVCPLVTDVGGNRAVLGPNLANLLVPPDDEAALAAAWLALLGTPTLRTSFGLEAQHRVRRLFSVESMVAHHARLYEDLLAGAARHGSGLRRSAHPRG